jgi:hypothetical protein
MLINRNFKDLIQERDEQMLHMKDEQEIQQIEIKKIIKKINKTITIDNLKIILTDYYNKIVAKEINKYKLMGREREIFEDILYTKNEEYIDTIKVNYELLYLENTKQTKENPDKIALENIKTQVIQKIELDNSKSIIDKKENINLLLDEYKDDFKKIKLLKKIGIQIDEEIQKLNVAHGGGSYGYYKKYLKYKSKYLALKNISY